VIRAKHFDRATRSQQLQRSGAGETGAKIHVREQDFCGLRIGSRIGWVWRFHAREECFVAGLYRAKKVALK
jgi:hypothetical protein